jgi:hypothetical protein
LDPCKHELGFSFREAASYSELAVFSGNCPSSATLSRGEIDGAVYHAVTPVSSTLPEVGELDKSLHAFVVVLRDEFCRVVGFGCTEADLSAIREVQIAVRAWDSGALCEPLLQGGCRPPAECAAGRCAALPGADDGGCDLTVVASGALAPAVAAGARRSGPAVAALSDGFVIAYREQETPDLSPRMTVVTLTDWGKLGLAHSHELPRCVGGSPSDGIGLAATSRGALVVSAVSPCKDTGAGAAFLALDGTGAVVSSSLATNLAFADLTLAPSHALAPGVDPGSWELAYRAVSAAPTVELAFARNTALEHVSPLFDGVAADFGQVATTPFIRAVLGRIAAGVASPNRVVLQVGLPSPEPPVRATAEVELPDAVWGALTAWLNRAAAVVPTLDGSSLRFAAVDVDGVELATGHFEGGPYESGDIVTLHEHLLVVGSRPAGFTLFRIDGATSLLSAAPAATLTLSDAVGSLSLKRYAGRQMAVAAARERVALVWLNEPTLEEGERAGGWALLSCPE